MNLASLSQRQLIFVTGKGGVGKTTVSAALGAALHDVGRRVLVLEVDPRDSLYPMFDVEPSGGRVVEVTDGLYVQNLRPREVLDAVVREQLGIELIANRVLRSPVYRHFSAAAPGLEELAVLGHVLRTVRGLNDDCPAVDLVLLDAPASGHGLSLLVAPRLVADVIPGGPFGEMASELASFLGDESICGVLVVTQAEEMPIQEAIELIAALDRQLSRRPDAVLINALYPRVGEAASESDSPAVRLCRERRKTGERESARLAESWPGQRVELPLLALERGPSLVGALRDCLVDTLES